MEAQTITYDPTPADQPELNEAEIEALARGEAQAAEENRMLAGKYESAEELEKAYIELQKKLGETNDELREEGTQGERREEEVAEEDPAAAILTAASEEFYANNGQLTQETVEKLTQMDSTELLNTYLKLQGQQQPQAAPDLTESEVNSIKGSVGGEEAYSNLLGWAAQNLPQDYIQGFDNLINSGDAYMIQLAVQGLQANYQNSNGYEGTRLSGKAAPNTQDVFRSQAEVVQAMSDPRYDRDPAYRNDVFAKLDRSNLSY